MTGRARRPAVLAGAAVLLLLLLGACSGSSGSSGGDRGEGTPSAASTSAPPSVAPAPSATASGEATLTCAGAIADEPPGKGYEVVLGVVALPTSPGARALQTSRTGEADPAARLFAKTGLVVRAGARFTLAAPPGAPPLTIGWGRPSDGFHPSLAIPGCPDTGGTGWLAYPGGYRVADPACVVLVVRAGGREQQVRVGLGTPCPGQLPPDGPSER